MNSSHSGRNNIYLTQSLISLFIMVVVTLSCTPSREFLIHQQHTIGHKSKEVRVLLQKTRDAIVISSLSKIRISEKKSGKVRYHGSGRKIIIRSDRVIKPVRIESWNSPIKINGKPYRGHVELYNVLGTLHVVNVLDLDEYLYGVVPSEMPVSWHIEALKAQAIAARTYALYHIFRNNNALFDLDATTKFQVYRGIGAENIRSNKAVKATSGEIIVYHHKPILSYFHSTCGGKTIDDRHVWKGEDLPYLVGVQCPFCKKSPKYSWHENLSVDEIRRSLRKEYPEIRRIKGISLKKICGRVTEVVVRHSNGRIKLTGNQFRLLVSARKLKSLFFKAKKNQYGLSFFGHGWGHGVGMCQYGAKGMAEKGVRYKNILHFYYKNIDIENMNSRQTGMYRRQVSYSSMGIRRSPN